MELIVVLASQVGVRMPDHGKYVINVSYYP